jgi:acetyl-CoA decarbonylase/synthase complex subunit gamma
MELNPTLRRYPAFALAVLLVFGLEPSGIVFRSAWDGGWPYLALGMGAVVSGAFLTPVALPIIPFRAFAIKGWLAGLVMTGAVLSLAQGMPGLVRAGAWVLFPLLSSYIALQFTGSTTYTGISGVKRELRFALPLYLGGIFVTLVLVGVERMSRWGIL